MKLRLFEGFMILAALLFAFIAVSAIGIYIREIFRSFGQADRSLLFWYLPILFAGIFSGIIAASAGVAAYRSRSNREDSQ